MEPYFDSSLVPGALGREMVLQTKDNAQAGILASRKGGYHWAAMDAAKEPEKHSQCIPYKL
jgi:hypothetical protein